MILFLLLLFCGIPFFHWMISYAERVEMTRRGDFILYWNRLSPAGSYAYCENWLATKRDEINALKREY